MTVVHYDARLTVDIAAGRIAGTVVLTARGRGAAADSLQLDSGDLVVDAVTVDGRGVEFSTAGHRTLVRLPHRLQAGEQVPVSVTYHGEPHGGIRFLSGQEQVYTAFSTSQWMVCVDAPDQKATLRLSVAVPPGLVSVGSGRAVGDHEWVLDTPVSTYLFGFAAGRFHTVTDVRHGVRLQYVADSYSDAGTARHLPGDARHADVLRGAVRRALSRRGVHAGARRWERRAGGRACSRC